jgi:secreted PhoX family phosphatase
MTSPRDPDDIRRNPTSAPHFREVAATMLSRRAVLAAGAMTPLAFLAGGALARNTAPDAGMLADTPPFGFAEIPHGMDADLHVPEGYQAQVLLRWGDPLLPGAPAFDPKTQTGETQRQQFGYNCDFTAFLPLPLGSDNPGRGLLCVNHEFIDPVLMHPVPAATPAARRTQAEIEMAAVGHSVVEIRRTAAGSWQLVPDSRYHRRFEALSTVYRLSGPAAGHSRMRTQADPSGTLVRGMLGNCAGGVTPWGTVLTCEENFNFFFSGKTDAEPVNHQRFGVGTDSRYAWGAVDARFDLAQEPLEPNRYGWVVEIDPYDPDSVPVKRTALGRAKHECANTALCRDGRVAVYSGDDQYFEFVYKFVTEGRYDPRDRRANRDLLDAGILYVARFNADQTLDWLPLVFGVGPLTPANGFYSQADVVIEARRAGTLVGATPMDRPEDLEISPRTGRVYVILTKNDRRTAAGINPANPRADNRFGQIVEIIPDGDDHAAVRGKWDFLLLGGDPRQAGDKAQSHPQTSANGWLACPDNGAFDNKGRLWVTTDGAAEAAGFADALYACITDGPWRGYSRQFCRMPVGAEATGPCFTPDDRTLFLSVQHPGQDSDTYAVPKTRWPDFQPDLPPRPSVVAIVKKDGGVIGG